LVPSLQRNLFPLATGLRFSPAEEFKHTFDVNFIGVQNVTSAFLPLLRQGTKKIIVDVSTFLASLQLNDGRWKMYAIHAYNVSKAALNFLVRTYAAELVDEGFTVIAMNPGV
jgi:NAD(P)-dependent dehydrogenase (short-subunit alcohol dehydrogenase family)